MWASIGKAVVPFVTRVLVALGIGASVYTGMDYLLSGLSTAVYSHFGQAPAEMLGIFGLMGVDQAISIIVTATLARATFDGVGGTMKRVFFK